MHFQHTYDKNGNIKAIFNTGMFYYLWHEISKYTLDSIAIYIVDITIHLVLPQCINVFTKTLGLLYKHKI